MQRCIPCCPRIRPSCVYYNFDNFTFSWSATFLPSPRSYSMDSLRHEWRPSSSSLGLRSPSVDLRQRPRRRRRRRRSRGRQYRTAEGRSSHRHLWSRRSLSVSVVRPSKRSVSIASFRSAAETEAPRPVYTLPAVARRENGGR